MDFPLITEPRKPTEFELQAELFGILKQRGYKVRGEVGATCRYGGSRFDLVVYSGSYGACIIEVKDSPHEELLGGKLTQQSIRYAEYGVPVIYYTTLVPLEDVLARVKAIIRDGEH